MMSAPDIIDKYGWRMNQGQLEALQQVYPVGSPGYAIAGTPNDG